MNQISFLPPLPQKPTKQVTVTPKRRRKKFSVWLEVDNPAHKPLIAELNALKSGGQMSPHLRSALELWFDLQQGGTAVLEREFPHLLKSAAPIDLTAILNKLDRLQALPPTASAAHSTLPAPLPDDDGVVIEKKAVSNGQANFNFILSSFQMGIGTLQGLPLEVVQYAIEQNRFPASALDEWHKGQAVSSAVVSMGPKKMNIDTNLAPPPIDDDDDDNLLFVGAAD